MTKLVNFIVLLTIFLVSCSTSTPVQSKSQPQPDRVSHQKVKQERGQQLPIEATANIREKKIALEVARTQEQQSLGLMYRTSLPDDRGMLFVFDPPRPAKFWMKNVTIPLDMLFLRQGVVVAVFANVPPCSKDPCPTYGPTGEIDQVIELRSDRAQELGVKVGDSIPIEFLKSP